MSDAIFNLAYEKAKKLRQEFIKEVISDIDTLQKETVKEFSEQGQGGYRYLAKLKDIYMEKYPK